MGRWYVIFLSVLFLVVGLHSQFSPGDLSKYHSDYEGNRNCILCHELRKKEISDGCVECHTPLKTRIEANLGYHRDKSENCEECHSDHNGREFELVYWPKDITEFDHNETGYSLSGKHTLLKCNQCHTQELIGGKSIIQWASEYTKFPVLDRTFLGLSRSCISCHTDAHRKEVSMECTTCHNTESWKLASKQFDHKDTKFMLTGAHKSVTCEKCHFPHADWSPPVPQLTGLSFFNCTPCHEDFHLGSYGPTCETCHTTTHWKEYLKPFNHSQTNYPLIGKHGDVTCTQCHKSDLMGGLPRYLSCMSCHQDEHFGQFVHREDGGDCAPCHTVSGYKPTTFTVAMHKTTRFVLDGGHLAVPCVVCHKPYEPEIGIVSTRFVWENNKCGNCHEDIHRNQFEEHFENHCDMCHRTASFTEVIFDHQKTEFPLDGKHGNVACEKCHISEQDGMGTFVVYYPVAHNCADCHTLTEEIR